MDKIGIQNSEWQRRNAEEDRDRRKRQSEKDAEEASVIQYTKRGEQRCSEETAMSVRYANSQVDLYRLIILSRYVSGEI